MTTKSFEIRFNIDAQTLVHTALIFLDFLPGFFVCSAADK